MPKKLKPITEFADNYQTSTYAKSQKQTTRLDLIHSVVIQRIVRIVSVDDISADQLPTKPYTSSNYPSDHYVDGNIIDEKVADLWVEAWTRLDHRPSASSCTIICDFNCDNYFFVNEQSYTIGRTRFGIKRNSTKRLSLADRDLLRYAIKEYMSRNY